MEAVWVAKTPDHFTFHPVPEELNLLTPVLLIMVFTIWLPDVLQDKSLRRGSCCSGCLMRVRQVSSFSKPNLLMGLLNIQQLRWHCHAHRDQREKQSHGVRRLLLLGESKNVLNEIGLEGATVLRPNHCLHVLD